MGIGNIPLIARGTGNLFAHYPSWGLETTAGLRDGDLIRYLITPHGDWKLVDLEYRTLHGSTLITPHGDWKPSCRSMLPSELKESSLPLMGIGNLWSYS